jgi:hypothetical protein
MKKFDPGRIISILVCLCVVGLLMLPTAGFGQDSAPLEPEAPSADDLEGIIVYGDVPLALMRGAVYRAEDNYFATFNELNSTDEFDIYCRWESPTGTHMKYRQCRARFYSELEAQAAREWRDFGGPPPQQWLASREALIQRKAQEVTAEMERLVAEHPELFNALKEVAAAQDKFEAEKERRCAGRILFCTQ